jgi:AcrR family transcriptional regulator
MDSRQRLSDSAQRTHRGRPRDEHADQAIIDATIDGFVDEGYEGLSVEGIATRAGVSKATIYRRWPSKKDLLVAAIESLLEELQVPDTGNVRGDLTSVVRQARRFLTESKAGDVLPRMVGELASGSELGSTYMEKVMAPRLQALVHVISVGKVQGDLREDLDELLAVASIIGTMMFLRITGSLEQQGDDLAERLIAQLIGGWRP